MNPQTSADKVVPARAATTGGVGGPADRAATAAAEARAVGGLAVGGPQPADSRTEPGAPHIPGESPMIVLLVEDDDGDAYLVSELLAEADATITLRRAGDLAEAQQMTEGAGADTPRCVLLDLNLPDASGLDGLRRMLWLLPSAAIIVLTGLNDEHSGMQAVSAGAQDFLNKSEVDGPLLARAIRYAVERQESHQYRAQAELESRENARLERGLLPDLLVGDSNLRCYATYRPGSRRSLLGGDFYDLIVMPDGALRAVIGDVCGHGPDEAALGVELRVAWRTLTLAGHTGPEVLSIMQRVLVRERRDEDIFATVCTLNVDPGLEHLDLLSAGHPPPLTLYTEPRFSVAPLLDGSTGAALGIIDEESWAVHRAGLAPGWSVMLFTDGLIEGRIGMGSRRLGEDGLAKLLEARLSAGSRGAELLGEVVTEVERLNGDALADDLAVLLLTHPNMTLPGLSPGSVR